MANSKKLSESPGSGQDRMVDVVVLDVDTALTAPSCPDSPGDRLRDCHGAVSAPFSLAYFELLLPTAIDHGAVCHGPYR
ncbi:hypothetical protein [Streptomyces sp. NPDC060010]|uniref:hypothetical protein n=1 Tax=Streptomyces sp. NPDC060010 TaxID=3347036 RepID=UPI003698A77B